MSELLLAPEGLDRLLRAGAPVHVLDVRWRLDRPDGRPAYRAGHIPGAVYVDLERELSAPGRPGAGRHPLPDESALQEAARRWGVREGAEVVVYDDIGGMSAARAWWLLADAGVPVRLLDGGWQAWIAAGLPHEQGERTPEPGDVTLTGGRLPRLDIDEAAALARTGVLLDVRAPERYRGEVEPVDTRAGHIPGARSLPTAGNLDADGRFLPAAALRERALAAGARPDAPVGVYCGSGVSAAHAALALQLAGFAPQLFPGSWSQWAGTPGRPVATGDEPG